MLMCERKLLALSGPWSRKEINKHVVIVICPERVMSIFVKKVMN